MESIQEPTMNPLNITTPPKFKDLAVGDLFNIPTETGNNTQICYTNCVKIDEKRHKDNNGIIREVEDPDVCVYEVNTRGETNRYRPDRFIQSFIHGPSAIEQDEKSIKILITKYSTEEIYIRHENMKQYIASAHFSNELSTTQDNLKYTERILFAAISAAISNEKESPDIKQADESTQRAIEYAKSKIFLPDANVCGFLVEADINPISYGRIYGSDRWQESQFIQFAAIGTDNRNGYDIVKTEEGKSYAIVAYAEHAKERGLSSLRNHIAMNKEHYASKQSCASNEKTNTLEDNEAELRKMWTAKGVTEDRQNELIASITAKAQPGAYVGPFIIQSQITGTKSQTPLDQALTAAIKHYGRSWRKEIGAAWMNGNYQGLDTYSCAQLQQARNTLGPKWLAKVKDPRGMER